MTKNELETFVELLDRLAKELSYRKAPQSVRARAEDARFAVEWVKWQRQRRTA